MDLTPQTAAAAVPEAPAEVPTAPAPIGTLSTPLCICIQEVPLPANLPLGVMARLLRFVKADALAAKLEVDGAPLTLPLDPAQLITLVED